VAGGARHLSWKLHHIPGYPYVGSAETIAQQLLAVIEAGDLDGFVLTFPDFIEDLRFFGQRVLPLLAA
jgi:alkanesulfonate monooxygenase SsuD/methylene tetrahydromethanopterin reductase-like flavin-dependent oxidoreductase (luciferase family)